MSEQQSDEDTTESTESTDSRQSPDSGHDQQGSISDDQLPEDLQPTEDNPLARHPGQTGDDDDRIGADTESGNAGNPSANMAYGNDPDGDGNAPGESQNAEVKAEEDDGSASLDHGGGGAG